MSDSETSAKAEFSERALDALRLGAILLVVYWCYRIVAPFIPLMLWGAIVAVAIYPMHLKQAKSLGDRKKLSATLMTLLALLILTTPVILLTKSLVTSSMEMAEDIAEGSVEVPPPPRQIRSWPLVGEKLHESWHLASQNPAAATEKFGPQLEVLRGTLVATAGGAGAAFLQMFFSLIIAGVFLATAEGSLKGLRKILDGVVGERSSLMLHESVITIRSVARGVLGVAILESILAAIGLAVAGVPAAGFWTFLILVLSIVQVPPLLPLIPLNIYAFATGEPVGATVFVVLSVLVVAVDTFVKPVLLGRTADAPMLIILVGAIGGMMVWGIVGLFVGAVLLVLAWEGLDFWVMKGGVSDESAADREEIAESAAES